MDLGPNRTLVSPEEQRQLPDLAFHVPLSDGLSRIVSYEASGCPMPLAPAQEEIWRRSLRADRNAALYNEAITIHRRGPADVSIFQACMLEIIRRHESWRTTFDVIEDVPLQVVLPPPSHFSVATHDLTRSAPGSCDDEFRRLLSQFSLIPFDLRTGPLLRAALFKLNEDDYCFSIVAHQSIVDGISAYRVLPAELAALYDAFSGGRLSPLPALPVQYRDFSLWHRRQLKTRIWNEQVAYWAEHLRPPVSALNWPPKASAHKDNFRGATFPFAVPSQLAAAIVDLARAEQVSLFMVLLAGFVALLHHYSHQDNVLIGSFSPCGRKQTETRHLLGYFLNPVALRFDLSANPKFSELLLQVRQVVADAIANDDIPIELVARELGLSSRRDPFVKVMISLLPRPPARPHWDVTTLDGSATGSPWDFYLAFIDSKDGLIGRAQFNPELLEEEEVIDLLRDLWTLFDFAVLNPQVRVADLLPS
jgi:hypothetical protein